MAQLITTTVTGDLTVTGNTYFTASQALTASFFSGSIQNAVSAAYASNAQTSTTSTQSLNATSSIYAITSQVATQSLYATQSISATSASFASSSLSASFLIGGSTTGAGPEVYYQNILLGLRGLSREYSMLYTLLDDFTSSAFIKSSYGVTQTTATNYGSIALNGTSAFSGYTSSLWLTCNGAAGSTTFTDSSSWGRTINNNAAANGSVLVNQNGPKFGNGFANFPGPMALSAGANLTVGTPAGMNIAANQEWTLQWWGKKVAGANQQWFDWRGTAGECLYVYSSNGNVIVGSGVFAGSITTTVNVNDGNWHHIVVARDNTGSIVMYGDGVKTAATLTYTGSFECSTCWEIGDNNGAPRGLTGSIDDLVFTRGKCLYTSNFTPPTAAYSESPSPAPDSGSVSSTFVTCSSNLTTGYVVTVVSGSEMNGAFKVYATRDSGSTYLPVTMSLKNINTLIPSTNIYAGNVTFTGNTGSNLGYRVDWSGSSAGTVIYAIGITGV